MVINPTTYISKMLFLRNIVKFQYFIYNIVMKSKKYTHKSTNNKGSQINNPIPISISTMSETYNLTPQEAIFVAEYVNDWDELKALKEARLLPHRYTETDNPTSITDRLLKKPAIQAAIHQATQHRVERILTTKDKVISHLYRIATADIGIAYDSNNNLKSINEIPYALRCCISKIKSKSIYKKNPKTKEYEFKGYFHEFELENKTNALKELARILMPTQLLQINQYNQENNIENNLDLSHLNIEDADKLMQLLTGKKKNEELMELERIEQCNLEH